MKPLSIIFNRPHRVEMTRAELATIVAPFIKDHKNASNASIAFGFHETKEWLDFAFDKVTDKGSMFYGLRYALCEIAHALRNAPESCDKFAIKRTDLEALKAGTPQLFEAARYLKSKSSLPEALFSATHAKHETASLMKAMKLKAVYLNLQSYFEGSPIRQASGRALERYVPKAP